MKKKILLYFISGAIPVLIVTMFMSASEWPNLYLNERRRRNLCRNRVHEIHICLLFYVDTHDGRTPKDLYELLLQDYLRRSNLVCPAKYRSVDRAGLLADDGPLFVSSYRLLVANEIFGEIPNGTVILREFEGNHPEAVIAGHSYPAGYHVIVKDHNDIRVDFIPSSDVPTSAPNN